MSKAWSVGNVVQSMDRYDVVTQVGSDSRQMLLKEDDPFKFYSLEEK